MAFTLQANKKTTISGDFNAGATNLTLATAAFTNFTNGYLVVDYDNDSKFEIIKCTVTGTAVTSITRGQDGTSDVSHSSGAKIGFMFVPAHYADLANPISTGGWNDANQTWTYASATTITISGDVTGIYSKGDKIRLKQGGSYKYFYITNVSYGAPNTTLTITGGTDYTLANSTITDNYYSKLASPNGFPTGFAFVPTYTGFSATPTTNFCRFSINGSHVHFTHDGNGTSNTTALTFTLPVAPKAAQYITGTRVQDNSSVSSTSGQIILANGSTTATAYTTLAGGGWTASGSKGFWTSFTYEMN